MQLFSVNLIELQQDGTPLLDAAGNTIATYGQTEIGEFAKVFTGYTYASATNFVLSESATPAPPHGTIAMT